MYYKKKPLTKHLFFKTDITIWEIGAVDLYVLIQDAHDKDLLFLIMVKSHF